MECPYCKKEMKSGHLVAETRIVWQANLRGAFRRWLIKEDGDFLVSDNYVNFLEMASAEASFCPECNVLIKQFPKAEDTVPG